MVGNMVTFGVFRYAVVGGLFNTIITICHGGALVNATF